MILMVVLSLEHLNYLIHVIGFFWDLKKNLEGHLERFFRLRLVYIIYHHCICDLFFRFVEKENFILHDRDGGIADLKGWTKSGPKILYNHELCSNHGVFGTIAFANMRDYSHNNINRHTLCLDHFFTISSLREHFLGNLMEFQHLLLN